MLAAKVGASAAVGLTGLIGSGKSHVRKVVHSFGALVVDADLCAHQVYKPDSLGWTRVINEFGDSIVLSTGEIDRAALGKIVFEDAEHADTNLKRLTDIVWPATRGIILSEFQSQIAAASARRTEALRRADFECEHSALYSALCDGSLGELLVEFHSKRIPVHHLERLLPRAAGPSLHDDEAELAPPSLPLLLPQPVLFLEAAVMLQAQWDSVMDSVWCTTVPSAVAVQRVMHRNALSQAAAQARVAAQLETFEAAGDRVGELIHTDAPKHETRRIVADRWLRLVHALYVKSPKG